MPSRLLITIHVAAGGYETPRDRLVDYSVSGSLCVACRSVGRSVGQYINHSVFSEGLRSILIISII